MPGRHASALGFEPIRPTLAFEMLSFFKRKKPVAAAPSWKARVQLFWGWYAEVGPRFFKAIESGKCGDLASEVSAKVDELLPGLAWVFGPGPEKHGHSF